ncbi:hypothetical protein KNV38_gp005 [uncultured phage cr111_1]|uniref:Uncharacterized protein n=1 Tax=uncultured phage cr111_1 TaxID=2772071 RepID=A0A7M1RXF7_9CAUD|nr:hypothetical protein KNV38_gp005 [uncultured phage cr111_1]QOR59125.1 hypothetical protein [uncultured phage cr111_1]
MSVQTISIPWSVDEADSIHLTWDTSGIPGTVVVTITSDVNTTGATRLKNLTFTTLSSSGPQKQDNLAVIQDIESLVIVKYNGIVSTFNDTKAGFKQKSQ